ncbi:MAG: 3-hydroxyacyl-CoA dehydrogenase NAD-binding domain-containing protein [Coriobacteriales bacterium]|nr:3-hydroxybutyryl-CoA dehydrogenase [Actinomycetes bacterium]
MSTRRCAHCGALYPYDIESCTLCGGELEELPPVHGVVVASTRVETPSRTHEQVPYWVALVRDDDGRVVLTKRDADVDVGDALAPEEPPRLDETVGVLGYGAMGRGLVELLLLRGASVVWWGRFPDKLADGRAHVFDRLTRSLDQSQIVEAEDKLTCSTDMSALSRCDLVIEAVAEDLTTKLEVLKEAEAHMRTSAVLATNTSSLSIDELASTLEHPERFGGLHFFNPPVRMQLVETVSSAYTSPEVSRALERYALAFGKVPVNVAPSPGFVVNRALMRLLNEAVRELEEGVASAQDIDCAIRLGLNHPMGPLELADLIGVDVVVSIMEDLATRLDDPSYAPRPLLREMLTRGELGRKTGAGFYAYVPHPSAP